MTCECGCGKLTKIATKTDARRGHMKGKPQRFLLGHRTPVAHEDHHCWKGGKEASVKRLRQLGYFKNYYKERVQKGTCPVCGGQRDTKYQLCTTCRLKCRTWERRRHLKTKFGMSEEAYDQLLESQGGVCAICRVASQSSRLHKRLAVDHDHKTGIVRGLLCARCNTAIGAFNDDVEFLKNAICYLERVCQSL